MKVPCAIYFGQTRMIAVDGASHLEVPGTLLGWYRKCGWRTFAAAFFGTVVGEECFLEEFVMQLWHGYEGFC
jgi:hypothetical protein